MIVNQADLIRKSALYFTNRCAFIYKGGKPTLLEGKTLTFGALNERANKLANALVSLGIKTGTHVATLLNNCLEYAEIEFGLMKGGFPQTVLNPMLDIKELVFQIDNSDSHVVIIQYPYAHNINLMRDKLKKIKHIICFDGTFKNMLNYEVLLDSARSDEPQIQLDLNALGELRYTSGTSGTPKGIMLPFRSSLAVTRDILIEYLGDLTYEDKWLAIQPLFHGAGWFVLPVFIKGMTQYIVNDFHARTALDVIESEGITAIKTIPTVLLRLLDSPDIKKRNLSKVKTIIYGGEPMPKERLKEAMDIFGPVFMQLYGQTEAPMIISVMKKEDYKREHLFESVGRPCTMVKVKVVDEKGNEVQQNEIGEVIVKGDHMMSGYLKNPEATDETIIDGWLHTKDLGYIGDDGYLYLAGGRTTDMIISGGENIYPQEVERVLYQHPAIWEACVFGVPDKQWGEVVIATVALKKNRRATELELIDFCKQNLASFKKPKKIYFIKELPRNIEGKVLRKDLKLKYQQDKI